MTEVQLKSRPTRRGRRTGYLVALTALLVMVAVPFQSAGAATNTSLWVKSTGNNVSNCRTKSIPCKTITYALTQAAVTGTTTINLLSNVDDEVDINKSNITVQSSPSTSTFAIKPTTDTLTKPTPAPGSVSVEPIVYVGPTMTAVLIKNVTIDGSVRPPTLACVPGKGHTGLYVRGASVKLANANVTNISQGPSLTGCQNGGAIYVRTGAGELSNVSITGGTVSNYDKNGITCNSVGTTCTITNTTVVGRGAVGSGDAAQNGIQYGFGAVGTASGVTVRDHNYTPGVSASAAGILLYDAGNGVAIKNSNVYGNNVNIYAVNDGGFGAGQETKNLVLTGNKVHDAAADVNGTADGIFLDSISTANAANNKVYGNSEVGIGGYALAGSTIKGNTVNNNLAADPNGEGISLAGGSTGNTVSANQSNLNTGDGIHAEAGVTGNTFIGNTMNGNGGFEAHDESTGGGTSGTGNTWTTNHCSSGNDSPNGLCH
jgi:hypothetical protein